MKSEPGPFSQIDPKAFSAALHGMPLSAKEVPGLLLDVKFNKDGDPERISYLVEIKGGKQQVTSILPP